MAAGRERAAMGTFIGIVLSIPAGVYRWIGNLMPFMRKSRAKIIPDGHKVIPQAGNRWLELNFVYRGSKPRNPLVGRVQLFGPGDQPLTDEPMVESDSWLTSLEPQSNDRFRITIATDRGTGSEFFAISPVSPKYNAWADPDLALQSGLYRVQVSIGSADLKETVFVGELLHSAARGIQFSQLRQTKKRLGVADEERMIATALAAFPAETLGDSFGAPDWLKQLAETDREGLGESLHNLGEPQYGNIGFNLNDEHAPWVDIVFRYVNASIYTIVADGIEGVLHIEHEIVAGGWNFRPVEMPRNRPFLFRLRWTIDNEISLKTLKRLTRSGETLYVSLDNVKVRLVAKEDAAASGELRFPPQFWVPREKLLASPIPAEPDEEEDTSE